MCIRDSISLGHRSIAMLAGPPSDIDGGENRLLGYRAALAAHGLQRLDPAETLVVQMCIRDRHGNAIGIGVMQQGLRAGRSAQNVYLLAARVTAGKLQHICAQREMCIRDRDRPV